ncbi:MAG: relaxase/mobilization nuclease domain-containing protein [Coleofasciculaceae cyanobacterium]
MSLPLIAKQTKGRGFRGLLNYLHSRTEARLIGGNMEGTNPRELAAEFRLSYQLNSRVKKPVYHSSLSVGKDKQLSDSDWNKIAFNYLQGMGFEANQWVLYRHSDREHDHIHIVASRVRLDTTKVVEDWWDYKRSEHLLRQLEKTHGLIPLEAEVTSSSLKRSPSTGQKRRQLREEEEYSKGKRDKPPELTVLEQLQNAIDEVSSDSPTMPELVDKLKDQGIDARVHYQSTGRINGISYALDGVKFSGTKLGKAYTFPGLQKHKGVKYSPELDEAIKIASARVTSERKQLIEKGVVSSEVGSRVREDKDFNPKLSEVTCKQWDKNPGGGTGVVKSIKGESTPTIPHSRLPTSVPPKVDKTTEINPEQRELAQLLYPLANKLFFREKASGKTRKTSSGSMCLEGREYTITQTQDDCFELHHRKRGQLLRVKAGKLDIAQSIQKQDIDSFENFISQQKQQRQQQLLEKKQSRLLGFER